jgi:hypothetical protein
MRAKCCHLLYFHRYELRFAADREENLHTVLENGFGHRIVVAVRQGSGGASPGHGALPPWR